LKQFLGSLSRKVEGIGPAKPWQPLPGEKCHIHPAESGKDKSDAFNCLPYSIINALWLGAHFLFKPFAVRKNQPGKRPAAAFNSEENEKDNNIIRI
jgi:hypothetical protein